MSTLTLKNYKDLACLLGPKAQAFIDEKIEESPFGSNEIVFADESQMLYLLTSLDQKSKEIL